MMQITDVAPVGTYQIISAMTETFLIAAIIGILLYIINRRSKSFPAVDSRNMRMSVTNISLVLLLIAILGPAYINISPRTDVYPSIAIFAISWQYSVFFLVPFMFGPDFLLVASILMCLKFVFIYQLFKYYYHATTRIRVIIVGIISELQLTLMGLILIPFAIRTPGLSVVFSIPIPVLLLTGLLIMKFIPVPPLLGGWEEIEKPTKWWKGKDGRR